MANSEALRIARELREQFRNQGVEFTQDQYRDALRTALASFQDSLFEDAIDRIAEKVDRDEPDRDRSNGQLEMFDLDGEYKLGGSRRIAKQFAQLHHAHAAMAIKDQNLMLVQQANLRVREELVRLTPHWHPGMTKAEAVAAYYEANPEG